MMLRGIRARLLGLILATVVPFTGLIAIGLWTQWRSDQAAATQRAIIEARLLAAQVDDHMGNLESLLAGLSKAVSTNPADRQANDVLLKQLKKELPKYISNVFLFALDGTNIGIAEGAHFYGGDRSYFRKVLAGERVAVGEVLRGRAIGHWVITVARRIEDNQGRLVGVLAAGTLLEHFQDALRTRDLPPGSVIRIVNEKGIVIAQSDNPNLIGRDLSAVEDVARHIAGREGSEITVWQDGVERITGSSTAHLVPWLVSVGLPKDIAFASVSARLRWSAAFSAVTLVVGFVIAWILAGRIVRPLRELGKDASVLAAGELSHRTVIRARDEVGLLGATFNKMASSLERRHEEAERAAVEVRQAKDTLAAVIDASPVAIICSDLNRRIVLWNRAAEQIFGYSAEEVVGEPTKLLPPGGAAQSQDLFLRALAGETVRDVQVKRRRKDGSLVDVRIAAAPMYDPDGTARGVAWAYEDITDRKQAEEQLQHLAHYDPLTGLPNRVTLQRQLATLLEAGGRDGLSVALFDLDGFKDVNDTLGHSTGDLLLIQVGQRLSEVAGGRGQVCRLGGDEFVVIVPGCGDPRAIGEIVDAMLERLAEPFQVNDHILHIGGSAGIAIAPNDGVNGDELIANADLALYRAKSDGGRVHRFFLPVLRAQAQARRSLDLELRRAFAENEFELFYQPQIRLKDDMMIGAEALLRWRHPTRGILLPGAFVDTLSESSIALDVGRWILRSACERSAAWRAQGLPLARIAVNLFPAQLHDNSLLGDIESVLRESGLPAEALELEITENVALNNEDATAPLQELHEKGVKIAFDDFGTGYASLSYLTRFPLSRIKIDRSFVAMIDTDAEDAAIVRSLIAMAHNLGLGVIAEGVETETQAAFLIAEQCEEAQGFLYSKPLSVPDFEAYLETKRLLAAADVPETPAYRPANLRRLKARPAGRRRRG
jgi:diguanylate cyclase (GGDEF)-like protein/PAS domain S-box-containing protein